MNISLEKNDRICFLGDSITHGGLWIKEVFEYFLNNYRELKIGFYNCGIAGSRGYEASIKNRLYCDCFNLFPKYAVVMFGMNDTAEFIVKTDVTKEELEENYKFIAAKFEESLEHIISECERANVIPIICSPTPYDEYNEAELENRYLDTPLSMSSKVAEKVAERHKLLFVDMRTPLIEFMDEFPIKPDRIHPNEYGQHLMAEAFLTTIGAKAEFEPEKECVFSEKNEERFKTEQLIRSLMYIERDCMLWQRSEATLTLNERKAALRKRAYEDGDDWLKDASDEYSENIDYLDELRGKLVKQTVNIYD